MASTATLPGHGVLPACFLLTLTLNHPVEAKGMMLEPEDEFGGGAERASAPEAVPLAEWRALFYDSPLAIAYISRELHLLRVNGPLAVLCGRMAGEVLGQRCYAVLGEHGASRTSPRTCPERERGVSREAEEGAGGEQDDEKPPSPCPECRVREALRTGVVQTFERPFGAAVLREVVSPVGERRGRFTGAVLMLADVTQERELRQQVNAAQRLAAVGTMTSSVAHELRNPLTSVLGFAQLLQRRQDLPADAHEHVERVLSEARRCDHIVNHLLKFTRRRDGAKAPLDANSVIAESLELLRHPLQMGAVRVHKELHPKPLHVLGHFCELQQVVQNIMNNALDAIRESGRGGNLTVRTSLRDGWAVLELENDGPPIAEPHKLFQPFYTTKGSGKGTGLGLNISNAIIREHGGRIEALNLPNGVVFRIVLPSEPPLCPIPAQQATAPGPPEGQFQAALQGTL